MHDVLRIGTGVELEVFERAPDGGADQTLLVLHDLDYLNGVEYPFVADLAQRRRVLSPSHPGFGGSSLPTDFETIDDFAYVYLDLLRDLGGAHVLGFGFGGWIAAEVAIRCTHHIRSLVLVDALGIKVGDRTTVDIKDFFVINPQELVALSWHDAELGRHQMPLPSANGRFDEDQLVALLTNRRTAALVGWKPFMHSPGLRKRLARIDRPTLVVWGDSDGIVSADYGRAFAGAIPHARFELIERAGHYPYLEQPAAFVKVVEEFLQQAERPEVERR